LLLFLSPTFQRFAVRTSRRIEDISVKGMFPFFQSLYFPLVYSSGHLMDIWWWFVHAAAKKKEELAEQVKDLSKNFEVGFYVISCFHIIHLLKDCVDYNNICCICCSLSKISEALWWTWYCAPMYMIVLDSLLPSVRVTKMSFVILGCGH